MAFFKDREAGFPKKDAPKKDAPAAPAAKKESDLPPMPAWQGHVYYANVPATAANGIFWMSGSMGAGVRPYSPRQ